MTLARSAFKRSIRLAAMAGGLLKEEAKRLATGREVGLARLQQARILVEELGRLKGTAMKFGQMLALEGRDFFPPEVTAILEKLQNQASSLDERDVRMILARELGDRERALEDFSPAPIAAASIGQVHRARYRGEEIVLKVQYPGVETTIDSDLKILRVFVERVTPLFLNTKTDYSDVFTELGEMFRNETHYLREAEMTRRYGEHARSLPGVRVPRVIDEISTDRVLALSFERGESLSTLLRENRLSATDRAYYADLFLRVYLTELSEWGLVQTDPNLGNFLIDVGARELVLLDFGAAREYPEGFRRAYGRLVLAAAAGRRDDVLSGAETLGLIDPRESTEARDAFFHLIDESMRPFRQTSFDFREDPYAEKMRELGIALIRSLRFTTPPRDLLFLHRKLGGIFQILRRLEVSMDLRPHLETFRRWEGETG